MDNCYLKTDILNGIFKKLIGDKKVQILEFLADNCDEEGFLKFNINEICELLNTSKPTVIATFKILEDKKILYKIKNGLYKLNLKDELSRS